MGIRVRYEGYVEVGFNLRWDVLVGIGNGVDWGVD